MKTNSQPTTIFFRIILLLTCFMLVMLYNQSKAAIVPVIHNSRVLVNFKTDILKNELAIRVKYSTGEVLQLFIFTADGILVKEVSLEARKPTVIRALKKGFYLYECFNKDERMKSGNLIIK